MTERNLFRTALGVLGSTILVPGVVALSGVAVPEGKTVGTVVKDYLTSAAKTVDEAKNDGAADDTKTDDTAKETTNGSNDQAAKSDNASTQNSSKLAESTVALGSVKPAGTYTVKEGDTYGCIAEKYYGSYDQWPKVYSMNAGPVGYDEYYLAVGAKLQMPAVSGAEVLPKTSLCQ